MDAAIYTRLSLERHDEGSDLHGLGVQRQEADCRELAAGLGWRVAEVYCDPSVSAYSGKVRPAYQRMLADLEAGRRNAIVCWDTDRLVRRPVELEGIIDLADRLGVALASVGGEIDLSTPQGRLVARIKGATARHEGEQSSRRIKRSVQQRAEAGRPHGRVAYGWRRLNGHDVLDEAEAAVIREATRRITAGESLRFVAADLTHRGIPTPNGLPEWKSTLLRQVLQRERNAGLRLHRRQVIGLGDWDAIVSEDEYSTLISLLASPERRTSATSAHKHLLSGIARCGRCGAHLRVTVAHDVVVDGHTKHRAAAYTCPACFKVRRKQAPVDALISKLVVARLMLPDALKVFLPVRDQELITKVAGLRARLALAADQYADGNIDAAQLGRISTKLRAHIAELDARLAVAVGPDLHDLARADIADIWADVPLGRQRAVISLLLDVWILSAARPGRAAFQADAVKMEWKVGPAGHLPPVPIDEALG